MSIKKASEYLGDWIVNETGEKEQEADAEAYKTLLER
jgi:hypothetical protein